MKKTFRLFLSILTCSSLLIVPSMMAPALSAEAGKSAGEVSKPGSQAADKELPEEPLATTQHSILLRNQTLNYLATAGYMPIKDDSGKLKAKVFFVAYTKDGEKDLSLRPITFAFNGGPGSSSIWLHLGALGPKRVLLTEEGKALPPPYKLVSNDYTWLGFTDLVFIDPVGTGYSRPAPGVEAKEFFGVKEDIA
jgi:carboxypeptidase C (cathepsin A)